ncbi:MAG: hypothetical protein ACKO1M_07675, partial [Planctomycetota bacterium]
MQAILHIGDMKCGSKSIQGWLAANDSPLRGHGFHRAAATKHSFYDSGLACYALDDGDLTAEPRREHAIHATADLAGYRRSLEDRLAAEVTSLPTNARGMIFSHEQLLSLQPSEVERLTGMLRRQFSGLRVIAYLRRQDRLFLSLWGQRLKTHDPGDRFCEDLLIHRSYLHMLEAWERAVGRDNLAVRVFDRKAFVGGDLVADFRLTAGIPEDPGYRVPAFRNESLDVASQSLLLELREHLRRQHARERRRLLTRLQRKLRLGGRGPSGPLAFPAALSSFLWQHCTGSGLRPSRGWAERIVAACDMENEQIRHRYGPDRAELFDRDFSEYPPSGGAPGEGSTSCDPEAMRREPVAPPEPEHVEEAYRIVVGRRPTAAEIRAARERAVNIAHLYATLLSASRV